MHTTRKLVLAGLATLVPGCYNPFAVDPDPTLEIWVNAGDHRVQWHRGDTITVQLVSRLDDPKGLAGLEVVIGGEDMGMRTYTASYFARGEEVKFKVPATGNASVTARIVQDGRTVAQISKQWALGSKIQWTLDVDRSPWPSGNGIPDNLERPVCQWFWCHEVWRSPIAEGAANYADEALWVTLYRYHPDECADLC